MQQIKLNFDFIVRRDFLFITEAPVLNALNCKLFIMCIDSLHTEALLVISNYFCSLEPFESV